MACSSWISPAAAALVSALLLACGGGRSGGPTDATGDVQSTAEDGLRLEILSSIEGSSFGDVAAQSDDRLVVLDIRLINEGHEPSVPVAFPLFTIRSDAGIEFFGSDQTAALGNGCVGDALVAAGGRLECSLAFEVPRDHAVVALVYRLDGDVELVLPFDSEPCTACGDGCFDLTQHAGNCGACGQAVGENEECIDGAGSCVEGTTRCGSECVDLQTTAAHCGGCDSPVPNGRTCVDGAPGCPDFRPDVCDGECVNLQTHNKHCGVCGHEVVTCRDGEPYCPYEQTWCPEAFVCTNRPCP